MEGAGKYVHYYANDKEGITSIYTTDENGDLHTNDYIPSCVEMNRKNPKEFEVLWHERGKPKRVEVRNEKNQLHSDKFLCTAEEKINGELYKGFHYEDSLYKTEHGKKVKIIDRVLFCKSVLYRGNQRMKRLNEHISELETAIKNLRSECKQINDSYNDIMEQI